VTEKSVSILLVEDNPGDRRLIREMLAEAGGVKFNLECAERLQAALEYLGGKKVEAVLLDLGLPDSQGLETLRKIYSQAPGVPIVVLTGLNDELVGAQAVNNGAQDYLIKGQVDTALLVRTVRYAMERKQAEERERQLKLQLDLSNRMASLGVMVEGIAHEINNPLANVTGFAELLMNGDIPEDARELAKTINDSAQRIFGIVNNLLAFARQQKLERTYVDINDILSITLAMRAYPMEAGGIKVSTQLDAALPRTMGDAALLQQVFLNLIVNAETEMNLAHGKGNLLVRTEMMGNSIQVSFIDDGPGIAEPNLIHLFDPFFSTRQVGQGIGLGLSVCYGVVSEHGGQIRVKSQLAQGSVFIVELPVVSEGREAPIT
jgi:signal transduction histidine kinase